MIRLSNLTIGFDRKTLLDNASAVFAPNKLTALIGRNGSGKSTLLKTMAGLNGNYSGEITINGYPLDSIKATDLAKTLSFVPTGRIRIPQMKCSDIVALGRTPYTNWIGRLQPRDRSIVMESLETVGMESMASRDADTLSDGEFQRVMIARALAQDTAVILLDEPTSFLDIPNRFNLVTLLHGLAHEKGKCIVFSTHELDIAEKLCDDISLIDNGGLITLPVPQMRSAGHIGRIFSLPRYGSDSE